MNRSHAFPGLFIAIEGIDGAGKTTQAHAVQDGLQARGYTVVRTKEPTSGVWGQRLRDSAQTGRLSLEEEVELLLKDRQEHVREVIIPALKLGHIIIADRYYFSTLAYQGGRGRNPEELMAINEEFAPQPDLLVLLDIEPARGLERIRARGDQANHFEKSATLRQAREIFQNIQKPYKITLNALEAAPVISAQIVAEALRIWTGRGVATDASIRKGVSS